MNILFENETEYKFSKKEKDIFNKVIEETLKKESFSNNTEISITIVTNSEIQKINSKYRNIDKPTDVLSFPLIDFCNGEKADTENTIILGDIIISIEKVISQAKEYGHSIERELGFLTAHSMLHLLGYDHIEEEEEKNYVFKTRRNIRKYRIKKG